VGGLTLSLLCIYRKSVQEKVRDASGHLMYTLAWLELQNRIAKVARKKTEEEIYNIAAISPNIKIYQCRWYFFLL